MCEYNELLKKTMACSENVDYEQKKREVIKRIKDIVAKCSRFKIGKTGKDPQERFDNDGEYKESYDYPKTVYKSSRKEEVDELEEDLIEYFQNSDEYSSKCDNEQKGGDGMDAESGTYYIYVVVKDS
jgi:hypothetical protein